MLHLQWALSVLTCVEILQSAANCYLAYVRDNISSILDIHTPTATSETVTRTHTLRPPSSYSPLISTVSLCCSQWFPTFSKCLPDFPLVDS